MNFSTIYQTSYKNFNITSKKREKIAKIKSEPAPPAPNKNRPKKTIVGNSVEDSIKNFSDIADESIRYAVKNRFNIIYDTTITKTFSKILNIMKILEEEYKDSQNKYKIKVVLIEAEGLDKNNKNNKEYSNISKDVRQIWKQINGRHRQMIKEGYIRTIRKSLIPSFIEQNREGFNKAKIYFETNGYEERRDPTSNSKATKKNIKKDLIVPYPKYKSSDIMFIDDQKSKYIKPSPNQNIVNQLGQLSLKNNSNNSKRNE